MKCGYCKKVWIGQMEAIPEKCPHCGKATEYEDAVDLLSDIYQRFGEVDMRNGKRLQAYFSDLAPGLTRERKLLGYFVACDGQNILLDALQTNLQDPKTTIERIVFRMTDDLFLNEDHSRKICTQFWSAITYRKAAGMTQTTVRNSGTTPSSTAGQQKNTRLPPKSTAATNTVAQTQQQALVRTLSGIKNQAETASTTTSGSSSVGGVPTGSVSSVTDVIDPAFKVHGSILMEYRGSAQTVVVPRGILTIGLGAFQQNGSITHVILPDGVKEISYKAFAHCPNLRSISLPAGLETIGDQAFAHSGLTTVTLPNSLKSLGVSVFQGTNLEKANIPGRIARVPRGTFAMCASLREVELCHGVQIIEEGALAHCTNLAKITIPDTFEGFGKLLYQNRPMPGTDRITSVVASDRWKRTHPALLREFIPSANEADNFVISNNVLVRYYGRAESPRIPTGVTEIGPNAFSRNSHIRSITIPEGVRTIGDSAFSYCSNLQSVSLPNSLIRIQRAAFQATALTAVVISPNVFSVGVGAFANCYRLKEVTLSDKVREICVETFHQSKNIQTFNAPQNWKLRYHTLLSQVVKKKVY